MDIILLYALNMEESCSTAKYNEKHNNYLKEYLEKLQNLITNKVIGKKKNK